jgi:primosomal protein N' (replication factor Y)
MYPPFSRLVNFILSGKDEKLLTSAAEKFGAELRSQIEQTGLSAQLLGPAQCPLHLLRGQYRRHMFVKTTGVTKFVKMLGRWENSQGRFGLPSAIKIVVDVDPDDMM